MAAAPPFLPPLVYGGSMERRPEGPAGRGSSLLAMATRLRMVALHSCAPKLLLAWVVAKAGWTVMRLDF